LRTVSVDLEVDAEMKPEPRSPRPPGSCTALAGPDATPHSPSSPALTGVRISGIVLCLTIFGIPLGVANFKLIPVSLMPLGAEIASVDDSRAFGRA
jgi:hypothetical protein